MTSKILVDVPENAVIVEFTLYDIKTGNYFEANKVELTPSLEEKITKKLIDEKVKAILRSQGNVYCEEEIRESLEFAKYWISATIEEIRGSLNTCSLQRENVGKKLKESVI